ncbi:glycosyltransferase [Singulisphaera sp. Ch08]|uniref:Glycosyltransferase n=1 Tax=Singulisphaera sp. Ch08 TaxID=3120278 RepID=A0AAU7CCU3_9BACT
MSRLRIVLVMIEPPLPFGNAAARWFYVLYKGLVERGHQVTAFAACSQPEDLAKARTLFPAPTYDLRLYDFPIRSGWQSKWQTFLRPFSYMFSVDLVRDLNAVLTQDFDVLHLEQTWSGWLGIDHVGKTLVNVHYLAAIDLGEQQPRNVQEVIERFLIFGTEKRLLRKFRHFRTVSPRLEGPLLAINPKAEVMTVPLGLDGALYGYIPDELRTESRNLTLIGSMGWAPSHSAAIRLLSRLWPQIKRRVPDARLQIVGWSAREILSDYLGQRDVTIEENVPEIRPYFERASVMLYAPSRGSGMKVKIQEAMAFGIPVVTTSEGVEGLPALDGVHAGICEDDAGLIERTVALLLDAGLQNRQRLAARQLLEKHCGPGVTLDGIEKIYADIKGV